jgi:hypothetical protein
MGYKNSVSIYEEKENDIFDDCYNSRQEKKTYLFVSVLWAIYTDDLSRGLVGLVAMLDELFFKASVVFDMGRLIYSTLDATSC